MTTTSRSTPLTSASHASLLEMEILGGTVTNKLSANLCFLNKSELIQNAIELPFLERCGKSIIISNTTKYTKPVAEL